MRMLWNERLGKMIHFDEKGAPDDPRALPIGPTAAERARMEKEAAETHPVVTAIGAIIFIVAIVLGAIKGGAGQ